MLAIAIPPAALEGIYAHARESFPAECCGYLVGDPIDEVVRCRNAQDDGEINPSAPSLTLGRVRGSIWPDRSADRGFVISGRELLVFAKSFESVRPARIVYHSHTNGRAYFSDTDRSMARDAMYPVQHLVVALTGDALVEAAQFAWSADVADFIELARWPISRST